MKKAFTLIELVFVIIIVGILAAAIIPRMKSNSLQEAAVEFMSAIRYTQHLALVSDRYNPNDQFWYKNKWQFIYGFGTSSNRGTGGYYSMSIFSDSAGGHSGNPDLVEMAKDPLSSVKYLSGGYSGALDWKDSKATSNYNLGATYGITNITYSGCSGKRIAFDNNGRPFVGDDSGWTSSTDGLLTGTCTFTLHKGTESIQVHIEPETGYVHL